MNGRAGPRELRTGRAAGRGARQDGPGARPDPRAELAVPVPVGVPVAPVPGSSAPGWGSAVWGVISFGTGEGETSFTGGVGRDLTRFCLGEALYKMLEKK